MHISNTSSSYIDLVFTSLLNLIIDSGVHSSLHPTICHDQMAYTKFNLEITFPSSYLWEVWHYKDVLILNLFKEQLMDLIGQGFF